MATKIELLNSAYSWMRISGLTVSPTPEDIELGLWRMEDMMAEFFGRTVNIGYLFNDVPDPNEESGIERIHNKMVSSNLASELCVDFGKDVPMKLSQIASASWTSTSAVVARERMKGVAYPDRMPRGSGNRSYHRFRRFYPTTPVEVTDAQNASMTIGDINNYVEDFTAYLSSAGGIIASTDIAVSKGLSLVSQSVADDRIVLFTVEAIGGNSMFAGAEQISIQITTDNGRVETRARSFEIKTDPLRAN